MSVGRQQVLTQINSYSSFLIMVKRAQEKAHQHIYDTSGCYQASRLAKNIEITVKATKTIFFSIFIGVKT